MADPVSKVKYTLEEVSKHNSREDKWIVVRGKIYDVTPFLGKHPGGLETILDTAVNATSAFEAVGHSNEALQQMKQLLVGEVENYDPASDEAAAACSIC